MAIKIKFYENVWIIRALMSQIKWPGTSHRPRALLFALFVRCSVSVYLSVCCCPRHKTLERDTKTDVICRKCVEFQISDV